jgi:hypothetical protein
MMQHRLMSERGNARPVIAQDLMANPPADNSLRCIHFLATLVSEVWPKALKGRIFRPKTW